ncbi:MAG: hypothetical protein Q4G59_11270, partial [Planctomycetia bacterium]|nr:hypothetical protein [Planctomycetia bacterium]
NQPLYGQVTVFSQFAFAVLFEYDGKRYDTHTWQFQFDSLLGKSEREVIFKLGKEKKLNLKEYLESVEPERRDKIRQSQYSDYGICVVPPQDVASSFPQLRSVKVKILHKGDDAPTGAVCLLVVGRLCRDPRPTATDSNAGIAARYIGLSDSDQTNYVFMPNPSFWVYNDETGKVYARFSYEQLLAKSIEVEVTDDEKQ